MFITALVCCCEDCESPFAPLYNGVHDVWYAVTPPPTPRKYPGSQVQPGGRMFLVDVNTTIDTQEGIENFPAIGPDNALWRFIASGTQILELEHNTAVPESLRPIDLTRDWSLSWWEQKPPDPAVGVWTFEYESVTGHVPPGPFGHMQTVQVAGFAGPRLGLYETALVVRLNDGLCGQSEAILRLRPSEEGAREEIFFCVRYLSAQKQFRFSIGVFFQDTPGIVLTDIADGQTWNTGISHKTYTMDFYIKPVPPYWFRWMSTGNAIVTERLTDQIAIWPYALTDAQVETVWNQGLRLADDGPGFPH